MARMASLSEVDEEDEDADLRFRPAILDPPPAVVAVVVEGEQHETMNLEEVRRVVEEAKWMSCFSGCDEALHTFHASILFPLLFWHYPLSLSAVQALFGFLFFFPRKSGFLIWKNLFPLLPSLWHYNYLLKSISNALICSFEFESSFKYMLKSDP